MKAQGLYYRVFFDAPARTDDGHGPARTDDGHGGVEVGWDTADAVEARANLMFLRGGETVQAARLQGKQPIVVTIHNSAEARQITAGWRMRRADQGTMTSGDVWDGPAYNVRTDPVPTDDRRWLEITVEGGVAV